MDINKGTSYAEMLGRLHATVKYVYRFGKLDEESKEALASAIDDMIVFDKKKSELIKDFERETEAFNKKEAKKTGRE